MWAGYLEHVGHLSIKQAAEIEYLDMGPFWGQN